MHLVVIGNGVAGITAARHVRTLDPRARITVVSDESAHFFSRTALMYVYMGELTHAHTKPYEDRFWAENRIDLVHDRAIRLDADRREVVLRDGGALAYDRLVIATGSRPRFADWPGCELRGVQGFYHLADLAAMERDTAGIERAVVIGGGLIGIELAEMLHARGIGVTMLVRDARYYASVLPEAETQRVEAEIRRHGIDLRLRGQVERFEDDGAGRLAAVHLTSGERIEAGWAGVGIGVTPNVDWLDGSGVEIGLGVRVGRHFETNLPDVFAVGDCAELAHPPAGRRPVEALWYVARRQGATVARAICGRPVEYAPGPFFNSAKFFTLEWQTYGFVPPEPVEGLDSLVVAADRRVLRLVFEADGERAVVGVNALGTRMRQVVCERWFTERTPLAEAVRDVRLGAFDPEFADDLAPRLAAEHNARFPEAAASPGPRRGWRRWMSPNRLTSIPPGSPRP